ncbi:MAG: type I glyceraldehyde-3-phosphate dehydrogenase [Dehalococcoidia bacterium]|nr:type I glyceraldehyde-3-phosphate dehydrogenase [Dehalococcoidia bacterium]
MTVKVGINGFGRIGRLTLRTIHQRYGGELEVVAVNDLTDTKTNAHLFKYDSTYGRYNGEVKAANDIISVNGEHIKVFAERDPAAIPWDSVGAEIVIESTGLFTDAERAAAHLRSGAKKVIISAPAKKDDVTIVLGVNQDQYDPAKHHIISNASCTTNGLAPVAKVLNDNFGIQKAFMSTIHAYTNDQRLQDTAHKDLRRARAACENIVPTATGAATAISRVLPELAGKMHGIAFRVPTATVSLIDLVAVTEKDVTAEQINTAFREAAATGPLHGILEYVEDELVSSDFAGSVYSSSFDAKSTLVMGGNLVKVLAWYDNEWSYCCRLGDLAAFIARKGL